MASRYLSRIIAVVVIAAAVVVGVEVVVRLLGIAPPLQRQYPRMVPDPHLPFRPPSNASYQMRATSGEFEHEVKTNSAGFRDIEHLIPKPPGVFRILGLGDSFTFGVGASFDDTYLFRMERTLNARPGYHPEVEVIKAGVPRFYPETERMLLEHYGLAYEPDLVVAGLTPNDVSDTAFGVDAVTTDASGFLKTQEAKALGSLGQWLFLNSHAARIGLGDYIRRKSAARNPVRWDEIFRDDGFHEPEWRRIEAELTRMRELVAQAGGKSFVVLCIPQRGPWPESSDYPARRLRRWAARNEAVVVDALPLFRAAGGRQRLFWEGDPHCTPAGYRLVAEALIDGFDSASLVP
jgi:hypothetical protein